MEQNQNGIDISEFRSEITEIYSGKFSISEAMGRLRMRLLDLTSRNRLLNFRHPKGRSLQIIDVDFDAIYNWLIDNRKLTFRAIPEPNPDSYGEKKPEAREHAASIGINTNYELPPSHPNLPKAYHGALNLQTLLYPEELEKILRKISREAKTAIEETGTNMLYLVFGFLEFFEAQNSERPLNAPLIAVPVELQKGSVDPITRLYKFELSYTGDDIAENITLKEKLKQEFSLILPEFDDEATPESYLDKIDRMVRNLPPWRVKRQISLAFLSFAKLAIWIDLGNENIQTHPIIQNIFGKNVINEGVGEYLKDYTIDEHPQADIPLIYDADTSQHSALIDVLSGKNLVINGPPGTGKSQTITNIIAASLAEGKSVLFVSEKLAALQVVKNRLDLAGLGDFCLEFHSNKTQKRKFLGDIRIRMEKEYPDIQSLDSKIQTLLRNKKHLKRYADLINSKAGNNLGKSIYEILWATEQKRCSLDKYLSIIQSILIPEAPSLRTDEYEERKEIVKNIAEHFKYIESFGDSHPWYGFYPTSLKAGDDLQIQIILRENLSFLKQLKDLYIAFQEGFLKSNCGFSRQFLESQLAILKKLAAPPSNIVDDLLPSLFLGLESKRSQVPVILMDFNDLLSIAIHLDEVSSILLSPSQITEGVFSKAKNYFVELTKLGFQTKSLEEIRAIIFNVHDQILTIKKALKDLQENAKTAGVFPNENDCEIKDILALAQIAKAAPFDLLHHRNSQLTNADIREKIEQAKTKYHKALSQRIILSKAFNLDILPNEEEIRRITRIFQGSGSFLKWFRKEWRLANRVYKSIQLGNKKKSVNYCCQELTSLLKWIDDCKRFTSSADLSNTFGNLFQGFDTNFEKVERIVGWFELSQTHLQKLSIQNLSINLVNIEVSRLRQLSQNFESVEKSSSALKEIRDSVNDLLSTPYFHEFVLTDSLSDWNKRLETLSGFVSHLEEMMNFFKSVIKAENSAKDAISAMDASLRLPQAVNSLNSFKAGLDLLGPHFKGLETDIEEINRSFEWGKAINSSGLDNKIISAIFINGSNSWDKLIKSLESISIKWEEVLSLKEKLNQFGKFRWSQWMSSLQGEDGEDYPEMIEKRISTALENIDKLLFWVQYNYSREKAISIGLKSILQILESRTLPAEKMPLAFDYCFFGSISASLFNIYPDLANFSSTSHNQNRKQYAILDKEIIGLNGKRYAHLVDRNKQVPIGKVGPRAIDFSEKQLLLKECSLQRPRTPIRQIIKRAGRALKSLKPCFMMSPLSVAQYLEYGNLRFDVVIMDEASQLRPEETLGAIARGRQLIITGDSKQLPPTTFFDRFLESDEDHEEETRSSISGAESILDICQYLFPIRGLRWHYRSRHESLIAFSNYHFYKNLIIFPSPYQNTSQLGVLFHPVKNGIYLNRQNIPEAKFIVDAILNHMVRFPNESLGVVTLNLTQRDLIDEILDNRLRNFPQGSEYKEKWEKEGWPFFIKNLESVQGDERDVIFISTTFGKAQGTDKVRQNFGPISRALGWRRLNVLFTRARNSVHVFSSMLPEDVIIDAATPEGTKILRYYLDYAMRGTLATLDTGRREPESDFEVSVCDLLTNKGYDVVPQLGVAGYFIDIAVKNPQRPGEFLAAIECDGAAYHSGVSVRERDRIRQEILESLGWKGKIYRIWSTDWYRNRKVEAQKLSSFLDELRRKAESEKPIFAGKVQEARGIAPVQRIFQETLPFEATGISEDEELFVEVGDWVIYSDVEKPDHKYKIKIVEGPDNIGEGIINEKKPIAQALLGGSEGEVIPLEIPRKPLQKFRIIKIER